MWAMTPEMRAEVNRVLYLIATGQVHTDGATVVAAARCLIESETLNAGAHGKRDDG